MIKINWNSLGKQDFFWQLLACVHVFEFLEPKLGEVVFSLDYGMGASAREYDGVNKYIRITDIDEVTALCQALF